MERFVAAAQRLTGNVDSFVTFRSFLIRPGKIPSSFQQHVHGPNVLPVRCEDLISERFRARLSCRHPSAKDRDYNAPTGFHFAASLLLQPPPRHSTHVLGGAGLTFQRCPVPAFGLCAAGIWLLSFPRRHH